MICKACLQEVHVDYSTLLERYLRSKLPHKKRYPALPIKWTIKNIAQ